MTKEKREKSRWERTRDWASFVMSAAAFIVSLLVGYFTTIRRVDEVRVRIISDVGVAVRPSDKRIEVSGSLSLLFINSGTRPIAIVGMSVQFGNANDPSPYGLCYGVMFDTDMEPIIIEEKKIISRTVHLREGPFKLQEDVRLERPNVYSFQSSRLEPGQDTQVCLAVTMTTARRSNAHKDIVLRRQIASEMFTDTFQHWPQREPIVLWREVSIIFDDD